MLGLFIIRLKKDMERATTFTPISFSSTKGNTFKEKNTVWAFLSLRMVLKLKQLSMKIKLRVKAESHILMAHSMKALFLLDKETAMGCISPNLRSMKENGNPTASKAKAAMKSFLKVKYIKALSKTTNSRDKAL